MPVAILFYDVVVAIHVLAVVAGFGALFALPAIGAFLRANHPEALPGFYRATGIVGTRFLTPAWLLAFLAGVYLATDRDLWSEVWVSVPMLIIIALFGLAGAVFAPTERKLAVATANDGSTLSADTLALAARLQTAYIVAAGLVTVAIFFMVAKPGA